MQQFSIKNNHASALLDKLTQLTGQGKTETVIKALELYEAKLTQSKDSGTVIQSIRETIHPYISEKYRGKMPTKEEIEAELGMP